ncbi:class I lanthipeptide [Kordia jejudonensis]|uniref:class I lanthipeptide n=1 Tax=Kordia jejudonensis TaxID=1348245 RepID=UPI000629699C|nr:class I lanthipeptide [Kordia jejudonensis]
MKKKNLSKLSLKKSTISELNNSNKIIGGKEKSIHETNCNLCPPTGSNACPTEGCPIIDPNPGGSGLLCTYSQNITCIFC